MRSPRGKLLGRKKKCLGEYQKRQLEITVWQLKKSRSINLEAVEVESYLNQSELMRSIIGKKRTQEAGIQDYWENRVQDRLLQDTISRSWEREEFNNHSTCQEIYIQYVL